MLMFGLLVVPLVLAAGAAVDYTRAATAKRDLQSRSDSAALASSRAAALEMRQCKSGNENSCRSDAKKAGEKAGKAFFANLVHPVSDLDTDIELTHNATTGAWTAEVSFKGDVPTTLMKVGMIREVEIGGKSSASVNLGVPTYLNFYLLLDNSSSMGIASSQADMQKMISATQGRAIAPYDDVPNCVFACHQAAYSQVYYQTPKAQGVRFRIDDLRDATTALVDTAQKSIRANEYMHIKMGVYTFNQDVQTLAAATSNLPSVSGAVAGLDLPTAADGTEIANAVNWLQGNAVIGNGTGRSPIKPLEIAFLVSDGVEDGAFTGWQSVNPPTGSGPKGSYPNATGAISSDACNSLKQKGVTVAVVYTTYVPFPGTWRYDNLVQPFAHKISSSLESCASPGYFFTASEPGDIQNGMQALFEKALNASLLRLTN